MVKIPKPWGHELVWAKTDSYVGKILVIRKGHRLSYQYHQKKTETIFLAKGVMEFEYETDSSGRQKVILNVGDSFHIPPGMRHRMKGIEDCEVFEVSTPELDDVIRLEDDYARAEETSSA